jgi:hypothetical protein
MNLPTSAAALRVLCASLAFTLLALPAQAWNAVAHRTIAELVWRQMTPDQHREASDMLRQHPHYSSLLAVDVPAGVGTNEWVFLNAAVWPDWVRPAKPGQPAKPRSITKYDGFPHAIGYPLLRRGDTNTALLGHFFIATPNAEMVLSNSFATFRNRTASAHDRAVSLCWALHLCGDLHQPLHAANVVTKARPNGDQLGGHFIVRDLHGRQIDLHAYWDRLTGEDFSYQAAAALADELGAAPDLQPAALKEYCANRTIAAWVQESFRVAVELAYAEERVQYVHADAVASGAVAPSAIPMLKEDYVRDAKKIARRRIALAAWRLVDELKPGW